MARLPFAPPPGVFRNGTRNQARGRYFDVYHVRWYGSALGPTLGWAEKTATTLTGKARAAIAWRDNGGIIWIGVGTHSKLYVVNRLGGVFDITPLGLTVGNADASSEAGYGVLDYGESTYGTPRAGSATTVDDATQWTLDTWGQDLLAVSPADRKIYEWVAPSTGSPAAQVTNAPECDAIVVSDDRFVFALGTDLGVDDPRAFSWCDQEDNTEWTPGPTNQAGSYALQSAGRLMCGKRVSGGTLLLTTVDAWLIQYIGGQFVHSRERVGRACGAISRQCMAEFGTGQAVWMSPAIEFWLWNGGAVVSLPCEVLDYIKRDYNSVQISKFVATVNADNSEIEFRYCSEASTEIDRCVVWNYKQGHWNIGRVARTCGVDKQDTLFYPVMFDEDGVIYDHEYGFSYDVDPFARTGPLQLGNGDNIISVDGLIPDDATVGDVTAAFTVRRNPDSASTDYGPYALTEKTDFRFSGGMIEMLITGNAATDWRVGEPKLLAKAGEARG